MKEDKLLSEIREPLISWFKANGRLLPWREGKNPYHIWLSEIMLQQTRIEAVKKYYHRFIKQLPTIHDLAIVEEEKLLKLWEGLGYYNRARNLKKAAIEMEEKYQGKMPKSYEQLITLPGIGEYTAGAIASIAFQERVPAVDGNVLRVTSRILASREDILLPTTKKKMTERLRKIMPQEAGFFNEALMELGETICIPNGKPFCEKCPISEICLAKKKNLTEELPIREKKSNRRNENKTVFLLLCEDKIAIRKREKKGLLAGMYEFAYAEEFLSEDEIEKLLNKWDLEQIEVEEIGEYTHIFSHIEWKMKAYQIKVEKTNSKFLWVDKKELEETYAMPGAFIKILKKL